MILSLCFQVDLVRFFWRAVVAKPFRFSIYRHAGPPFVLKPNNPHKTRFVSAVRLAHILRVAVRKHISKIVNSIVGFVTVYVVNQPFRPRSINVQPCQTMGFVNAARYTNSDVANSFFHAPRNIAGFYGSTGTRFPHKNSCASVVIKCVFKLINGQFHLKTPVMSVNVITSTIGAQA